VIVTWGATDAERLDGYNGLLLAPHLDAAFDLGFITVAPGGAVVVSGALAPAVRVSENEASRRAEADRDAGHPPCVRRPQGGPSAGVHG